MTQFTLPVIRRFFFFFQAEDGIRDYKVTGVQTCALPIFDPRLFLLSGSDRDRPDRAGAGTGRRDGRVTSPGRARSLDRKSTRLNSSHLVISYAVFCLKKKKKRQQRPQRR